MFVIVKTDFFKLWVTCTFLLCKKAYRNYQDLTVFNWRKLIFHIIDQIKVLRIPLWIGNFHVYVDDQLNLRWSAPLRSVKLRPAINVSRVFEVAFCVQVTRHLVPDLLIAEHVEVEVGGSEYYLQYIAEYNIYLHHDCSIINTGP